MATIKERLQFLSEGGSVVRYHTRPGIKPDTDAHHMHGVAMLCAIIAGETDQGLTRASSMLLMAALTHDLAEQVASDVASPSKTALGIRKQLHAFETSYLKRYDFAYEAALTSSERDILNIADVFDGMLSTCRELALGNKNYQLVWRRWIFLVEGFMDEGFMDDPAFNKTVLSVYNAICEIKKEIDHGGPDFDCFAA